MRTLTPFSLLFFFASVSSAADAAGTMKPYTGFPDAISDQKAAVTNPLRVYPPSCLSHPLPSAPRGQALQGVGNFLNDDGSIEQATMTVWREPCGAAKSAILVRIDRTSSTPDNIFLPAFAAQTSSGGPLHALRMVQEPNTEFVIASAMGTSSQSAVYVLDLGAGAQSVPDLNGLVALVPVNSNGTPVVAPFGLPAYDPNLYPEAMQSQKLTGHLTGSYFDPATPGEGALVEVAEVGNALLLVITIYTFDEEGFPLWLVGAVPFTPGARTAIVDLAVQLDGRFGGQFNPAQVQSVAWGSAQISFPDCNSIRIAYQSTHSVEWLPAGAGTLDWVRLTGVNRLACE